MRRRLGRTSTRCFGPIHPHSVHHLPQSVKLMFALWGSSRLLLGLRRRRPAWSPPILPECLRLMFSSNVYIIYGSKSGPSLPLPPAGPMAFCSVWSPHGGGCLLLGYVCELFSGGLGAKRGVFALVRNTRKGGAYQFSCFIANKQAC